METPLTVCSAVLAYVQSALERSGRPVGVAMVAVGGVVLDDCCMGALYVAPERFFKTTDPFPLELGLRGLGGTEVCEEAPIALELVVSLFRCIPVLDDQGNAPSVDEQTAAYADILTDAATVWNEVNGVPILGDDGYGDSQWLRARVSQTFVPAEGGCLGIETRLTLGVGQSGWCGDMVSA